MYDQNETDETLVMLTLAGEQTAYEVLVTRYQKAAIMLFADFHEEALYRDKIPICIGRIVYFAALEFLIGQFDVLAIL